MSNKESKMKWDSFNFNYRLELGHLLPRLVTVEAYKEAALNLVLPPDWRSQLDRLNRIRAVYGTTALEGNPLSEAEVSHQIDAIGDRDKQTNAERITREQRQIRNAGVAQDWVRDRFSENSAPLTVLDIQGMHRLITEGSDTTNNEPGKFRTFSVRVGSPDLGGVHVGAPYGDLKRLMQEYVGFVNSPKLMAEHPVVRALLSHFFLVTIHPFGDGNGRVSRLVEAGILFQGGYNVHGFYGLSNYFYRNQDEYKTVLQKCREEQPFNVTPFIAFGVEGFSEELKGINNFIKTKLNRVVYRTMLVRAYNRYVGPRRRLLNLREYNLLDFLLMETEPADPFSENPSRQVELPEVLRAQYVKSAYKDVTPRTLSRELARLSELGFIKMTRKDKQSFVEIDFAAIGKY
jgi:Fic family protein